MSMVTLGLNAFHGDSAACILIDGQLRAAAEEERFRRIKHWAGFPSAAIRFCLAEVGLKLADVDVIAINTDPQAARWQKLGFVASGKASAALIREKLLVRKKRKSIEEYLRQEFPQDRCSARIEYVEHHLAHLASAYLVSPFTASSIVSVDGFGDSVNGFGKQVRQTDSVNGVGKRTRPTDSVNGFGQRNRQTDSVNGFGKQKR